jgi:hypothetical protein
LKIEIYELLERMVNDESLKIEIYELLERTMNEDSLKMMDI